MTDLTDTPDVDLDDGPVTDPGQAERYLAAYRWRQSELDRYDAQRDALIAYAQDQHADAVADHIERMAWLHGQLAGFHAAMNADRAKPRSVRMLGGTLKVTAGRLSRVVTDEAAALAWCRDNAPDAVVESTSVKVAVSHLPKPTGPGPLVTDAGEVIPGIEVTRGDDAFVVALTDEAES